MAHLSASLQRQVKAVLYKYKWTENFIEVIKNSLANLHRNDKSLSITKFKHKD